MHKAGHTIHSHRHHHGWDLDLPGPQLVTPGRVTSHLDSAGYEVSFYFPRVVFA